MDVEMREQRVAYSKRIIIKFARSESRDRSRSGCSHTMELGDAIGL